MSLTKEELDYFIKKVRSEAQMPPMSLLDLNGELEKVRVAESAMSLISRIGDMSPSPEKELYLNIAIEKSVEKIRQHNSPELLEFVSYLQKATCTTDESMSSLIASVILSNVKFPAEDQRSEKQIRVGLMSTIIKKINADNSPAAASQESAPSVTLNVVKLAIAKMDSKNVLQGAVEIMDAAFEAIGQSQDFKDKIALSVIFANAIRATSDKLTEGRSNASFEGVAEMIKNIFSDQALEVEKGNPPSYLSLDRQIPALIQQIILEQKREELQNSASSPPDLEQLESSSQFVEMTSFQGSRSPSPILELPDSEQAPASQLAQVSDQNLSIN